MTLMQATRPGEPPREPRRWIRVEIMDESARAMPVKYRQQTPVEKMDGIPANFEPVGRVFESLRAHQ